MYRLTVCIICMFTFLSASLLELQNNARIEGEIISVQKKYLYIVNDKVLFAIENKVIQTVDDEDFELFSNHYPTPKSHDVNFDAFEEIINIDKSNIFSEKTYTKIVQYIPDLNSTELPFEPPRDPALNIHNYFAIKPFPLLYNCVDITYGHRFINYRSELRISFAYVPTYEYGLFTYLIGSDICNISCLTSSLRYYYKPTCRGLYSGIGYNYTKVNMFDPDKNWEYLDIKGKMRIYLFGIIVETGLTGIIGNHLLITPSIVLFIGKTKFQYETYDDKSNRICYMPTVNLLIGYGF
jgi:hypothetical protein